MQVFTSLIVLGLCSAAFVISDVKSYKEQKVESSNAIAHVVGSNSVSSLYFFDNEAAQGRLAELRIKPDILNAVIFDQQGDIFASYTKEDADTFQFSPTVKKNKKFEFAGRYLFIYSNIVKNNEIIGKISLQVDVNELNDIIKSKLRVASLLLILGITLALIIAIFIQRGISAPLSDLVNVMEKVKESDDYTSRSVIKGKDEINTLSHAFNDMLEEIENREKRIKERTNQLGESEARLKQIVETAPDAVIIIDKKDVITDWNKQAETMFGWKETEVEGKTLAETVLTEKFYDEYKLKLKDFLETGQDVVLNKPIELSGLRKNNSEFPIELKISFSKINNKNVFVAFVRDITERKKTEEELVKSELKFKTLLESAPDALILANADGKITLANAQAELLFGYNRTELYGNTIEMLIPDRYREKHIKHRATYFHEPKARQMGVGLDLFGKKKDGAEFPVDVSLNFIKTNEGILALAAVRDITEQKKAKEKINQLNKNLEQQLEQIENTNKELESFSYSVSHDLRAPIRAINGFSKIVEKKYGPQFDEEGKDLLNTITKESIKMGRLIDDLLAFSRLGKKEIEKTTVDMTALAKDVVDEVLKLSEEKYSAKVTVGNLLPSACDKTLIRQIFVNLLSNALKFSHKKPNPVIEIDSKDEKDSVVYYVKDNGAGFDMKFYDKLFGVFQRLHNPEEFTGTGIGLAIVKRIIIRHGGKVWAEGKVNEGATFYFSLPKGKLA